MITTHISLTLKTPEQEPGPYSYPTDPDALQAEIREYLSRWWLTKMTGVMLAVDGVSQESEP